MEKTRSGRTVFGSNSGAVSINPQLIDKLEYDARIRFYNIIINSEEQIEDSKIISLNKQIKEGNIHLGYNEH